ncbi:amino acid ABC transporter substrate-binding protein [Noviherbaspirillum denitrificans]|uniref:ABC transporter substrate-binding protein n=1 Tax=Noviherbaspirillum denitrificans TaxID=1968433 RepID=A0A254T9F6_9BURK|nr:amino acid ABC transporter substrate-binding protein [Noviherbaspirillum denitrificans]OWW19264.1 ABC transporter substrate-binding protein [Noviherbaspirillum denitrificans]
MKRTRHNAAYAVVALACAVPLFAQAADEIVIGASLPLSGPIAGFGKYQQWGYQTAVTDANKRGGVTIDGRKYTYRLVIRDDKSDPKLAASNAEALISKDNALVLLGSCTPALVNSGGMVAERSKVPMVTGCNPLGAFRSAQKWTYVWDIFFDEADLAEAPFRMMRDLKIAVDKTIALIHDNGPDGKVVGGTLWPRHAESGSYTIKQKAEFAPENMQLASVVNELKARNPDITFVDAGTPQAVFLRKQMAAVGYKPKVLVMEKGAEPEQFAHETGPLADGVLVGAYWDPSFKTAGAEELAMRFERETGKPVSQHVADSNTAANVLIDAITAAQSLNREKINQAIGRTEKSYVVGNVRFDDTNTSKLPVVVSQWQNGKSVIVWPKRFATATYMMPK